MSENTQEIIGQVDCEENNLPFSSIALPIRKQNAVEVIKIKYPCCGESSEISLDYLSELSLMNISCPHCLTPILLNKYYKNIKGCKVLKASIEIDWKKAGNLEERELLYLNSEVYVEAKAKNYPKKEFSYGLLDRIINFNLPCCSKKCQLNISKIKECDIVAKDCPFCNMPIGIIKRNNYSNNTLTVSVFVDLNKIGIKNLRNALSLPDRYFSSNFATGEALEKGLNKYETKAIEFFTGKRKESPGSLTSPNFWDSNKDKPCSSAVMIKYFGSEGYCCKWDSVLGYFGTTVWELFDESNKIHEEREKTRIKTPEDIKIEQIVNERCVLHKPYRLTPVD